MKTINLLTITDGVRKWVQSMATPEGYKFTKDTAPTLLSNCFAILTMELLQSLADIPLSLKEKIISSIKICQQKESGYFIDPYFRPEDLLNPKGHDLNYISMQFTLFAINALDAVGEKPLFSLNFMQPYKNENYLIKWLEARDWKNPWLESNNIMFVGCFLLYEYLDKKNDHLLKHLTTFLDWHDEHQDPLTGYWGTDKGASLLNGMAGAFHIYLLYFYLNRPIQYIEKIIDSTLSLQCRDGLFVFEGGGGSCEDLDAIDILAKCTRLTDYRKEDIKKALFKALEALVLTQNKDGGFSWKNIPAISKIKKLSRPQILICYLYNLGYFLKNTKRFLETCYYTNWAKMPYKLNKSDIWSCWFRTLAIGLITSTYPSDFTHKEIFKFRQLPCLGWHF